MSTFGLMDLRKSIAVHEALEFQRDTIGRPGVMGRVEDHHVGMTSAQSDLAFTRNWWKAPPMLSLALAWLMAPSLPSPSSPG